MYRYRITVESLSPATEGEKLSFEAENHDNLFLIARNAVGHFNLDEDAAKAFAIGLKLFGETVLKNRNHPLFGSIKPAMGEFIKTMKAMKKEARAAEPKVATDAAI